MAARREHGAPSALTVLEVAEGLRWADPALGASLAEHVRRVAGDDPAVRAAADRSVIRSLAESDRPEDVVERGVPLLAEARTRGDRDDGAEVLVELAAAATGLGDAPLARRLLDRLGPLSELPARIGATACAARAESCAADGDVAGCDTASAEATSVLLRVRPPDSTVVRARLDLAQAIARRRAGDHDGALRALRALVSADPAEDVDGGRRALAAAAEETELLVERGRPDEARDRAWSVLPDGTPGSHVASAVGRIRLALAAATDGGSRSARSVAEDLEGTGRIREAARAWEIVASLAEAEGDLGQALAALRHGHGLVSRARDTDDRALRTLAPVTDGVEALAPAGSAAPAEQAPARPGTDDATPTGRRGRRAERTTREASVGPWSEPEASRPTVTGTDQHGGGVVPAPPPPSADHSESSATAPEVPPTSRQLDLPVTEPAPVPELDRVVPEPGPHRASDDPPRDSAEPAVEPPARAADGGPRPSARDELAELLASLTRSVDSSREAVSAIGREPAASTPARERKEPEPGTGRRSRHAAFPVPGAAPATEPPASRPTFDAFSTAPARRAPDPVVEDAAPVVAPLPDDRFAPTADGAGLGLDDSSDAAPRTDGSALSVSSLVDPLAGPREDEVDRATGTSSGLDAVVPSDRAAADDSSDDDRARPGTAPSSPPRVGSATDPVRDDEPARSVPGVADPLSSARPHEESGTGPGGTGTASSGSGSLTSGSTAAPGVGSSSVEDGRSSIRTSSDAGGRATSADAPTTSTPRRDDGSADRAGASPARRPDAGSSGVGSGRQGRSASPTTTDGDPTALRRPAPGRTPSSSTADEYDEELALTLATVLGEYHLPDVPMPLRRERERDRPPSRPEPPAANAPPSEVAVPSARRHTSGSLPVPGDQRWAARAEARPARPPEGRSDGARPGPPSSGGRGRPPESGARLADLLAEAMDAFRHVGPDAQEGTRGPGVGSRRA